MKQDVPENRLKGVKPVEKSPSTGVTEVSPARRAGATIRENAAPNQDNGLVNRETPPDHAGKPRSGRGIKPPRGGLIDSVHLAGMPKAA
jgi:hypothetical protein